MDPRGEAAPWLAVVVGFPIVLALMASMLAGYGMVMMGVRLRDAGEVTAVLAFPFYSVAYAIGGAFLIQTLVLFSEMLATVTSKTER